MEPAEGEPLIELVAMMRRLRAECAWKQQQTHRSLTRYLLEETHEVLEAIESGGPADLEEELGDLLLQIYFHAAIGEEAGGFTIDDVARGLIEKLVRRNPHVFAADDARGLDAEEVNAVWEAVKATEKPRSTISQGIAPTLPALLYADKVLDRLARAGRAPRVDALGAGLGDRLLALVGEAQELGLDPEQELREAVRRLEPRGD